MEIEKFYIIKVVKSPDTLIDLTRGLKNNVFLGQRGRVSGADSAEAFSTIDAALKRIESFKPTVPNRNKYEFDIVQCTATINGRGSRLTPHNFYIAIKGFPKERLEKQPYYLKGEYVIGGSNIPARIKKARWFATRSDADSHMKMLNNNPNFKDFKFEIKKNNQK